MAFTSGVEDLMTCPTCDAPVTSDARFCSTCGVTLDGSGQRPAICLQCSSPLSPEAQFCASCGLRVEGPGKRRAQWGIAKGNGTWRVTVKGREVLEVPDAVVDGGAKAVTIAVPKAATFITRKLGSKGGPKGGRSKS